MPLAPDADVIVLGARCAGATLAAVLAEHGLRVLVVDRAAFPSPTVSTHTMHADALQVLREVGVLDAVEALGAPRVSEVLCDYGDFQVRGSPPPVGDVDHGLCVPRERLDAALVRHACQRGAELAERTRLVELLYQEGRVAGAVLESRGGRPFRATAHLVVGADGRVSSVAREVGAERLHAQRSGWYLLFGYFADMPPREPAAYELYFESTSFFYVFPTCGGLHVVGGEIAFSEHPLRSLSGQPALLELLNRHPRLAERLAGARLVEGPYGMFRIVSFVRRATGPGWALVGDASFFKDPCTGQGMYDAFRGAQVLASRIIEASDQARLAHADLSGYGEDREREFGEWYRFACRAAQALPISRERRLFLRHVADDPELTREYLGIQNHAVTPSSFFNRDRLRQVMGEARPVR